ncbi:MAG: ABC transporter ATP-binding protein [Christensenellales bacterium]|jgi:ABC-2 type transport system ATP-binding protein
MLKIENLTKTYSGGAVTAVSNLSLHVKEGEIFGFIGPNGAGKSTTIKCITGILNFDSGHIGIAGIDLGTNPIEAKKVLGYVPDSHGVYESLTGAEFINFISDVYGVPAADRKERLEALLERFALKDAINNPLKSYSHGMKQKVSVIAAFIHKPKLLLLDEPLTGLDPRSAYELKELMREHCKEGNTVFFSSHVLDVVEKVCDRIGIIDQGSLVTVCTLSELKEKGLDSSLESLFLKITEKPKERL